MPLTLLSLEEVNLILADAFALLRTTGVRVQLAEALELLADSGAMVDGDIVMLPEKLVQAALRTVPPDFTLYDRDGKPAVHYGGDDVHFDPGSCAVHVLDPITHEHRPSTSADLIRLAQVTEMLAQFAAQSTSVVCHDVPKELGDIHRLYLVLLHSSKPVVTGAFSPQGVPRMVRLLEADAGGSDRLKEKPRAIFDVCPSPPLTWSEFGAQNLVDLGRVGVPAEIVSMPLAGAAAPVTLAGAVVQHAAECLAGILIHQLAAPGAPIVWGGAPAIFDMRTAAAPMGAIETAMIDIAYAQVGKSLGLPTHAYLCASDGKTIDAQAGMESGMSALLGSLAGINMISGAGMLDFLACQSAEKLVLDAEAIAMAQRLGRGVDVSPETLATTFFAKTGLHGDFLKLPETRKLFRQEQYLPSAVIDRNSLRAWQEGGSQDAAQRARRRVDELVAAYRRPEVDEAALKQAMNS